MLGAMVAIVFSLSCLGYEKNHLINPLHIFLYLKQKAAGRPVVKRKFRFPIDAHPLFVEAPPTHWTLPPIGC